MVTRLRCLPFSSIDQGMVLGAPLTVPEQGVVSFVLPAGHELTESNLRQMAIRQAEYACVCEEDSRSDEIREMEWAASEKRLQEIFRLADLSQPALAGLYGAVLRLRKS